MEFPVALLAVAALLFVTGVVGRGGTLNAPIGLKIEGKVGGIPRVILAMASAVAFAAALATFMMALPHSPLSNHLVPTATPPATATATAAPTVTTSPTATPTRTAQVAFTLLVGLRPQLGQISEHMELYLDGRRITSWNSDQSNPSKLIQLRAKPGRHRYELRGDYTFEDPGGRQQQREGGGTGTITIDTGTRLGVNYTGADNFTVTELP